MAPSKQVVLRSEAIAAGIDPEQTLKASKALLSHMKKAQKTPEKQNLLADAEDDAAKQPIWLTLTTKRHIVDAARLQPGKIPMPHPLNTDPEISICIISADPQRAYKNIVASEEFPEELRKKVGRVIDLSKLKAKFKQYEQRRQLFADHDVFLADSRIINRLPAALGKVFYKTTAKRPIPCDLSKRKPKVDGKRTKQAKGEGEVNACAPAEMAAEIEKAAGAALVNLSPSTQTAIRIGYSGWTAEQVADNAKAVAAALVEKWVPQKFQNVRSIYLKGTETVALPVWLTDELWLEEKDIANGEEVKALMAAEKPNIGKKRKSLEGNTEEVEPASKKAKKGKNAKAAKLPEINEDKLDKEIAERKAKLKKQKTAAKKALEV